MQPIICIYIVNPKLPRNTCLSSSQAFPIIWVCRNSFRCLSYTLTCPIHLPTLTRYLYYTSLSTWFSVFFSISFIVSMPLTSFPALSLLSYLSSYASTTLAFSLWLYLILVPLLLILSHSFLILYFSVTPHSHLIVLISFTSSLLSWLFVAAHVSAPDTNAGLTTVLYSFPFI